MPDDINVFETTEWERDLGPVRGSRSWIPGPLTSAADGWAFPAASAGDYVALTVEAIQADPGARNEG